MVHKVCLYISETMSNKNELSFDSLDEGDDDDVHDDDDGGGEKVQKRKKRGKEENKVPNTKRKEKPSHK